MKQVILSIIILGTLVACDNGSEPARTQVDCGEGTQSIATGDKNYTTVVNCLITHWQDCSDAVGNLTQYTIEGDPITETYHIISGKDACEVVVVRDYSQDRFSDGAITKETCKELSIAKSKPPLLTASDCSS